ncbi:MAG: protein-L-isoaspartate(D-aspartate) O-methyltransferase [Deltaproteobacteria bacterium]|nr:protein-L-isoaspartate(D-aspartate) O-methyltransferase [Deltaproteobacteria bacterium]
MTWNEKRQHMVDSQLVKRGIKDNRVIQSMRKVPRHDFVPDPLRKCAYDDCPLSIGKGQTISQPYMVAFMTECLRLRGDERVLEIGTGSGYQTAILAELAEEVYTIERIPELSERAQGLLDEAGYGNIFFKVGDGTYGWPERGPFEGIIVTAGAPNISSVLGEQLNEEGRMVVPVGTRHSQSLYRITKRKGQLMEENLILCIFVPLIGEYAWEEN